MPVADTDDPAETPKSWILKKDAYPLMYLGGNHRNHNGKLDHIRVDISSFLIRVITCL